jgi:hypothetical protein
LLREQLARHSLALGQVHGGLRYYFEPYDIYWVMEEVERGNKNLEKPFSGRLRGLYHVHHSKAFFIGENVWRKWNQKVKKSGLSEHDYLEKRATELLEKRMRNGLLPADAQKNLLKDIAYTELMEGVDSPRGKTGEWIIYAKYEQVNYFLALSFHNEGDENILEEIAPCLDEFPFLKSIVHIRGESNGDTAV